MKRILILVSLIYVCTSSSYAEQDNKHYLFSEFKPAVISFTSGNKVSAKMNYNIVYRQMIYQQGDNLLALSSEDIKKISKIEIDGRTFIPFNNGVCELVSVKPYIVAEYGSMIKPASVNIGMGATSSTTAAANVSHIISSTGNFQELKNLNVPEADLILSYYIYVKDKKGKEKLKKIRNIKQLMKALPEQKPAIEKYLSDNKTFDFKNPSDFKELYCSLNIEE